MARKTPIGWTDYSSNPIRFRRKSDGKKGWHCEKISTGCSHCYSEAIDNRFGMQLGFTQANSEFVEPYLDEKELAALMKLKGPAMVFPGDMTDLFLDLIPDEMLDRFFATMAFCPNLVFQVLTKRPGNAKAYFDRLNGRRRGYWHEHFGYFADLLGIPKSRWDEIIRIYGCSDPKGIGDFSVTRWPLPNLWLGVSAENQATADERIPILLSIPAAVRFVSAEPLLGEIDFRRWLFGRERITGDPAADNPFDDWSSPVSVWVDAPKLDQILVGGESGPKRRPMQLEWLTSIVEQCRDANVSCFVKQDSALRDGQQGRIPGDIWSIKQFPTPHAIGA